MSNGKSVIFLLLFLGLFAPLFVQAGAIDLNLDYPLFFGIDLATEEGQNLESLIAWFYAFIVGIAGLAAFVMIIWGGIQWMTSTGDPTKTSDAKDRIKQALLGLLLILASFVVLRTINPELTTLRIAGLPSVECTKSEDGVCLSFAVGVVDPKVDGVYVCRNISCLCVTTPCVEGSYSEGADYHFFDPNIWVPVAVRTDKTGVPDLASWGDHIAGLRILGSYGVLLADGLSFSEQVVCLQGTGSSLFIANLTNISHDDGTDGGSIKPWSKDGAQSLKILQDGICGENNKITLPNEIAFWSTPTTAAFAVNLILTINGDECANDMCSLFIGQPAINAVFEWESPAGATCRGKDELSSFIGNNADSSGKLTDHLFAEFTISKDYFYTIECTSGDNVVSDTVTLNITSTNLGE